MNKETTVMANKTETSSKSILKNILTDALMGKQDPKETIEKLSTFLFPEENLIEVVETMKIKDELIARFDTIQKKGAFGMAEITKENNLYIVEMTFADTKGFSLVHQNVGEICGHVAKKFDIEIRVDVRITQTFGGSKKEEKKPAFSGAKNTNQSHAPRAVANAR